MNLPPRQGNPHRKTAGLLYGLMWALLLVLLGYFFTSLLDREYNPNSRPVTGVSLDGATEVVLQRNHYGHYVSNGSINGQEVTFILDTGASDVSVPQDLAKRLGLKPGAQRQYQTANGLVSVYATRLDEVAIGGIRLHDVRATINPNVRDMDVLLGMSFLKDLEFTQRGDQLTLRQYSPPRR